MKNLKLPTRPLVIVLVLLLLILQYSLWFSSGGIVQIWRLKQQSIAIKEENIALSQRTAALQADVNDLKKGNEAIEERARNDLGMVKNNETFYQLAK
jgi:cell division protein FtsB